MANASPHGGESELGLLARVKEGDRAAFDRLCRRYEPRLTRFLFTLTRRPQIVEEARNDTLMAVWEGAGAFRGTSRLSTWIFAIAYRKAMKALRRQDEPIEDAGRERRIEERPGPAEAVEQQRRETLLAAAIDRLSPDHRAVVLLTYHRGLGYREIAEMIHCPVDTVKTRMFYARRHLRELVGGDLSDWI